MDALADDGPQKTVVLRENQSVVICESDSFPSRGGEHKNGLLHLNERILDDVILYEVTEHPDRKIIYVVKRPFTVSAPSASLHGDVRRFPSRFMYCVTVTKN